MNIFSINSFKRLYFQVDQVFYIEMVQDLWEDYKFFNYDQKFLLFKKVGDKYIIVDVKGWMYEMEIDVQFYGMFFLFEFFLVVGDGNVLNVELMCYWCNLFQISGSFCFLQVLLLVFLEFGEISQIKNMEVSIFVIEFVDGYLVWLIVILWKILLLNLFEVNQVLDQELFNFFLILWVEDEDDISGEYYVIYLIGWCCFQFRM